MKTRSLCALFLASLLSSTVAQAGVDPLVPVKEVMQAVVTNAGPDGATGEDGDTGIDDQSAEGANSDAQATDGGDEDSDIPYIDYLSDEWLDRDFSAGIAKLYREGSKTAAEKDEPFIDYEPVIGAQDFCPLKDVDVKLAGEKDGVYDVVASFKAESCFGDDGDSKSVTQTHFRVIEENGKPVIDDIVVKRGDEEQDSLKKIMQDYLAQQH
ncbi:hypothetical protein [Rhizobium sp. PAMB 3182]